MDFIFMLTRNDKTVEDALPLIDLIRPIGLKHIGFKDVGVDTKTLRRLNDGLKSAGVTTYMEVVSTTPEACLASARTAAEIGVDCLLGGSQVDDILNIIRGSGVAYFPFPGLPSGHPTVLGGTPQDITDHCRRFADKGCAGADLLAFRATEADPIDLVKAARAGLGGLPLIVAGSVNSPARIRKIAVAGADAFTIGSAVFDGSFQPRLGSTLGQLRAVLDACASVPHGSAAA